jgi:ribosomal protein S18 acetylase RimI-like enzyme
VRIERVTDVETLERGAELFDDRPDHDVSLKFLNTPGHHLLFAFEDERPVGFASGAELIHPDKGTEMYLNELGVDDQFQGHGIATQLVEAMIDLAKELGCRGMWDVTEPDNAAAIATYRRAGADDVSPCVIFGWTF